MTHKQENLKDAVMTAIENAVEAGLSADIIEETIKSLLSINEAPKVVIGKDGLEFQKPLSSQAKWYLNGCWPVYVQPTVGNHRPEPKAMEELEKAGLAFFVADIFRGNHWALTDAGWKAKRLALDI